MENSSNSASKLAKPRFPSISESEFSDFADAFGGLTHREAHAFYAKHDFWCVRAGVSQ
jgi:hypothetical protein